MASSYAGVSVVFAVRSNSTRVLQVPNIVSDMMQVTMATSILNVMLQIFLVLLRTAQTNTSP